jgi:hypothetical protein
MTLLGCYAFPRGGRCGRASLPPASSYGLHPSGEGTGPPARRRLVSSLQWAVAPFWGCEAPQAWIFGGELTAWVPVLPSFIWSTLFLSGYVYLMSEPP